MPAYTAGTSVASVANRSASSRDRLSSDSGSAIKRITAGVKACRLLSPARCPPTATSPSCTVKIGRKEDTAVRGSASTPRTLAGIKGLGAPLGFTSTGSVRPKMWAVAQSEATSRLVGTNLTTAGRAQEINAVQADPACPIGRPEGLRIFWPLWRSGALGLDLRGLFAYTGSAVGSA